MTEYKEMRKLIKSLKKDFGYDKVMLYSSKSIIIIHTALVDSEVYSSLKISTL